MRCRAKTLEGQTLIEVLIAFAVTVIIAVGLVTAGLATQKAAASARNEAQATKLAQEYIERLRTLRDARGWAAFILPFASGSNGDYIISTGSEFDVLTWALTNSWAEPTGYCIGPTAGNNPLEGVVSTANNLDFCRKVIVSDYSGATDTRIVFRVEVGWKEGESVKSVRAETILSKWCSTVIDPSVTDECDD